MRSVIFAATIVVLSGSGAVAAEHIVRDSDHRVEPRALVTRPALSQGKTEGRVVDKAAKSTVAVFDNAYRSATDWTGNENNG